MSTLEVPGYQPIHIDRDSTGAVWLYMGDNSVAFSQDQWHRFARMVVVASDEPGRADSRPDQARGRWFVAAAAAALARAGQIRAAAGSVPDLGAVRAAGVLSGRLGVALTADGVEELARRGLLPATGDYKGFPVYDGRVLEAFTDAAAAAGATRTGQLRTAAQSAVYLRVRRSDLRHLTRLGMLTPAKWGRGPWDRRGTFSVSLYRTGDLDQLADRPGIDWAAVRATTPGHRSPLVRLAQAETVLAVPAALPGPEAES